MGGKARVGLESNTLPPRKKQAPPHFERGTPGLALGIACLRVLRHDGTMRIQTLLVALALGLTAPLAISKPLKIYVLCGQSNMQGHAHVRTLDVLGLDPVTAPLLAEIQNADGSPRVYDDIRISSLGSADTEKTGALTVGFGAEQGGPKIGPELTFGITMHKLVGEPIFLIKTAWGGKSLNTDFRPPSAAPFAFREDELARFAEEGKDIAQIKAEKAAASGHYYRLTLAHVKAVLGDLKRVYPGYDEAQGHELAGFVWFQGWNDMVDGGFYPKRGEPGSYDAYSDLLAHFIRDVRRDLAAPELPFVIGVMGAGGPIDKYPPEKQRYAGIHGEFRKAMAAPAALPEFKGSVAAVWTDQFWDMELEELRAKEQTLQAGLKQEIEAGRIGKADEMAEMEKRRAEAFDERQLRILANGASNAEYHYLGSAKILGRIGQAFAEALHGMGG